jgi:hypothetical protein
MEFKLIKETAVEPIADGLGLIPGVVTVAFARLAERAGDRR